MFLQSQQLLQWFIDQFNYKSYLEIGCCLNNTFKLIKCDEKVGVDPEKGGTIRMTSNDFFESNTSKFDIIFIDGDHHHNQVEKDISNSLAVLNDNGVIVLHDCNPPTLKMENVHANGSVWRAFMMYRNRPDLNMIVLNFNHGHGIIRCTKNINPIKIEKSMDELSFLDLEENRNEWLNLQHANSLQQWLKSDVPVVEW